MLILPIELRVETKILLSLPQLVFKTWLLLKDLLRER